MLVTKNCWRQSTESFHIADGFGAWCSWKPSNCIKSRSYCSLRFKRGFFISSCSKLSRHRILTKSHQKPKNSLQKLNNTFEDLTDSKWIIPQTPSCRAAGMTCNSTASTYIYIYPGSSNKPKLSLTHVFFMLLLVLLTACFFCYHLLLFLIRFFLLLAFVSSQSLAKAQKHCWCFSMASTDPHWRGQFFALTV